MSSCPSLPTGPRKPCKVTYFTQVDKSSSSEPPPQPRVRKVTTVISSLAVVIRNTPEALGVWVLTACQEKLIPKTLEHDFSHYRLGTWLTVGVYPDLTVASFSQYVFALSAYPSSVDPSNSQLFLRIKASEFQYEKTITEKEFAELHWKRASDTSYEVPKNERNSAHFFMVPGFGRVLAHIDFLQKQKEHGENLAAWIQWCGDVTKGCGWSVNSFTISNNVEENFSERDLKEAAEIVKNREISTEIQLPSKRVVARYCGLITDVNVQKNIINVWSPNVSIECDHHAKMPLPPKHRDVETAPLAPLIGQWVQFDVQASDVKQFSSSKTGCRLVIPEYLPITSPCGIGVAHSNRVVRIMISSILVKGTSHPTLFELPHFGFVLDRKAMLVSGACMQLVIEKTPHRIRKACGVCWMVIESVQVHPCSKLSLEEMMVQHVSLKDAMDVAVISPVERQTYQPKEVSYPIKQAAQPPTGSSNYHSGITTLKYQQPPEVHYLEHRRDFYSSGGNRMPNEFRKRMPTHFAGATLEGTGLVEKMLTAGGVLWMFDAKCTSPDGSCDCHRTNPFTVHFVSEEPADLVMGDYVRVKLEQKADTVAKQGFRWLFKSAVKKPAPFSVQTFKFSLSIHDTLTPIGVDKFKRQQYMSTWFNTVYDPTNLLPNPPTSPFHAFITRKKIASPNSDNQNGAFAWVLLNGNISLVNQTQYLANNNFQPRYNSRGFRNQEASRSETSSVSPPLKTVSDE